MRGHSQCSKWLRMRSYLAPYFGNFFNLWALPIVKCEANVIMKIPRCKRGRVSCNYLWRVAMKKVDHS
jgi:hypothetical protein